MSVSTHAPILGTKLFIKWMNLDRVGPPAFPLEAFSGGLLGVGEQELREAICEACLEKSVSSLKEYREMFWELLPSIFGLGTWDDVKRDRT